VFLILACGCSDDEPERVSYAPPPLSGPIRDISVPDWEREGQPGPATTIAFPKQLTQGESLAFNGRIHLPGEPAFGVVQLTFRPLPGDLGVVLASGNTVAEKDGEEWFKYRIELTAPTRRQHCEVVVADVLLNVIARGEVDVE
jgi:hypothetical protein